MCVCICDVRVIEQADNKVERNVTALALITYLWFRLISKPTAEKHTVKEAGGVRRDVREVKRGSGYLTLIFFPKHLLALIK